MTFPPDCARVVDVVSERRAHVLEAVAKARMTERGASRIMRLIMWEQDSHCLSHENLGLVPGDRLEVDGHCPLVATKVFHE